MAKEKMRFDDLNKNGFGGQNYNLLDWVRERIRERNVESRHI